MKLLRLTFEEEKREGMRHILTDAPADGRTDGRRTDFSVKLMYSFYLKKKANKIIACDLISAVRFSVQNSKLVD